MFTSYIHCTRRDHLRRSIPHTKRVLVFYPRGVGCITVLDNTLEIIMNTEINKHKKIAQSDEVHISNSKHCSRIEHTFKGIKLMMIVAQKKKQNKRQTWANLYNLSRQYKPHSKYLFRTTPTRGKLFL